MTEFEQFWAAYPRRTARFAAEKAFTKARRLATMDELLAGIESYIQHKPDYADYAHPASWLNAGRWMDEYDAPAKPKRGMAEQYVPAPDYGWFEECQRLHGRRCNGRSGHALQLELDEARTKARTA